LSLHARFVPAEASVSKFSVSGESKVVILPLLVSAEEGDATKAAMKVKANNTSNEIIAGTLVNRVKNKRIVRVGQGLIRRIQISL
jgi:hypothetical protein